MSVTVALICACCLVYYAYGVDVHVAWYGVAVHVAWCLLYGVAVHVAWCLLYGVAVHVAWCTMLSTQCN